MKQIQLYEIFCFETKTSFKKFTVFVKKIAVFDTNSLEQFASGLKLPNSHNNFKHNLKDHFFRKLRNMERNIFAYWRRIRNLNCIFSISL